MEINATTISDINDIKTGDTLLVSSHSWLARKIQLFEKCEYNHAGMFFWNYRILFIAEMDKPGLVLTAFSEYIKGKSRLLILKPKFDVDGVEYGKYILPQIGKIRYGFFNLLFAQPIKFITGKRIWFGSNDDNPKRLICGEFVEKVYNHFHPEYFENWKQDDPSVLFKSTLFNKYEFKK